MTKHKTKFSGKRKLFLFVLIAFLIIAALIFGPVVYKIIEVKMLQAKISSFYSSEVDLKNKKPGEVLKIEEMKAPVVGGKAYRLLYVSQLPNDSLVPVSGMVFVPNKESESRNIVAWAHGTVGLGETCAPSRRLIPNANLEPWLSMMMDKGWIVVATDYTGLGVKGQNQYLVGESEGRDVLNSIRAVKNLTEFNPGEKAVVFGHSQGGHSALYSANIQQEYAQEIDLLGIVAAAPATELNSVFEVAYDKPLLWAIVPEIFVSWDKSYDLNTKILNSSHDTFEENEEIAKLCIENKVSQALIFKNASKPYFSSNPNKDLSWYNAFKSESPAPTKNIPTLILQGLADDVVSPNATALFVSKSCKQASDLESLWYKNVGHVELPNVTSDDSVDWIANRFNGESMKSNCELPLPVSQLSEVSAPVN